MVMKLAHGSILVEDTKDTIVQLNHLGPLVPGKGNTVYGILLSTQTSSIFVLKVCEMSVRFDDGVEYLNDRQASSRCLISVRGNWRKAEWPDKSLSTSSWSAMTDSARKFQIHTGLYDYTSWQKCFWISAQLMPCGKMNIYHPSQSTLLWIYLHEVLIHDSSMFIDKDQIFLIRQTL